MLKKISTGKYRYRFPADLKLPVPLEYKYNKGGWDDEELDIYGNKTANRVIDEPEGWIYDNVPRWRSGGMDYNPKYLPQIKLVDDDFEMPQLGKKRRIWALLPYDYDQSPLTRYPVLYLQDAQNLFDESNPFGTWGIDKKLAVLAEKGAHKVIVVGIDHGDKERIDEFSPFSGGKIGGKGEGKNYVHFLADTLKPHIDKQFRTHADRDHTGIGGSSMGGLISIYAGLMKPEIFGRLMVFSPSLWAAPKIYFNAIQFFNPFETKIYLYAGGQESRDMLPNVQRFKAALANQGLDSSRLAFKISYDPQGKHQESRWGAEFPMALEWLFFGA